MNQNRFAKRVALLAGFFFLCAGPVLTHAQSAPSYAAQTPATASPPVRPKKDAAPADYFAGLTFTDDQKAKIDEIHRNTKARMAGVDKDATLDAQQKAAMVDGYRRMENGQVFKLLTPEQQDVVRRKMQAQRLAEREEKKKQSLPK